MKPATHDPDYLDRLITERDAAAFLGYTMRALQNWRLRGGGPAFVKVSARSIRYRRRDLMAWIDGKLVETTSDTLAIPFLTPAQLVRRRNA